MSKQDSQESRTDYLNMSDEEMLNAVPPAEDSTQEEENVEEEEETTTEDQTEEQQDKTTSESDEDEKVTDEVTDESEEDEDEPEDKEKKEKTGKPEQAPEKVEKTPETEQKTVDYEAEYKRLLAPFKANGRDVEIKSVDDAITLMQMGANYNKKMAAIKPNLKVLKLLENHGLLNEEKLSYLIDLDKKNPAAIGKLVKESGIDLTEYDADKAGEYKPKIHTVDDREIALDTILDDIQDTASCNRTLSIVSKEWDGASRQSISEHPQLLKVINDHVERGIYDIINKEVEREKMLGRLTGLSDLEAYRQIGDAIQARGGFNHLASPQKKTNDESTVVVAPKPKNVDSDKLKEKKRAASSSKPGASSSATEEFNPLSLSDEEFAKLADNKFR